MWNEPFENLLRKHLPYLPTEEQLLQDAKLRDFGLDSLGTVELLASLESTYDVRFVDEALTKETFETPASLWIALSVMLSRPI